MIDLDAVEADLRRMQLEIERVLRLQSDTNLIQRHGSVRGRQFHVYNTLRRIQLRNQWKVCSAMCTLECYPPEVSDR